MCLQTKRSECKKKKKHERKKLLEISFKHSMVWTVENRTASFEREEPSVFTHRIGIKWDRLAGCLRSSLTLKPRYNPSMFCQAHLGKARSQISDSVQQPRDCHLISTQRNQFPCGKRGGGVWKFSSCISRKLSNENKYFTGIKLHLLYSCDRALPT